MACADSRFTRIVSIAAFFAASFAFAADTQTLPYSFTYQGSMVQADGVTPLLDQVDFVLEIYAPSGTCLLYSEQQANVDLSLSGGIFSLGIGSTLLAGKRVVGVDPGYTMAQVFSNSSDFPPIAGSCPLGYHPGLGDSRILRVKTTPHSTGVQSTLNPDLTMTSAPQAMVADTLQGHTPLELLLISNASSQLQVSQGDLELLFGPRINASVTASDASALHHHDGRYAEIDSGGLLGLSGKLGTYAPGGGTAPGSIWYDQDNKAIKFYDGTSSHSLSTAGAAPVSSVAGKTGAVTLSSSDLTDWASATSSFLTSASTLGVASGGTGATTLTGIVKGNGTSAFTAAVSGVDYLQASGATTNGNLALWNGSTQLVNGPALSSSNTASAVVQRDASGNFAAGEITGTGLVTGTLQVTGGTPGAGKVLTSDASGNATWTTPSGTTQWTTSGSDISYSAGNVGIGTAAPNGNLQIHATVGTNPTVYFSDADVTHGMTAIVPETNIVGAFGTGDTNGTGFRVKGLTGSNLVPALQLDAYTSATPTTPAVVISGRKKSLTNAIDLAAGETLFQLRNGATPVMTALGSGNLGIGTTTPGQKLSVAGTIESTSGGFKFPDGTTQSTAASGSGDLSAPGAIGATTPNTGAFTTVSSSTGITSTAAAAAISATAAPSLIGTSALVQLGSGGFAGGGGVNFAGSASGTALACNMEPAFAGNFADFQVSGTSKFTVSSAGNAYFAGNVGIGTTSPRVPLELAGDGAILATGTVLQGWTEPNLGAGSRMLWYPRKAAFRAGRVSGTEWNDANIGLHSTALGVDVKASGAHSVALGNTASATGAQSFAVGTIAEAANSNAIALATNRAAATGSYSVAIGGHLTASGTSSFLLGQGVDDTTRLVNSTPSSLGIGFNSDIPTLFVGPASGAGTTGKIGIGTTSPSLSLDIRAPTGSGAMVARSWVNSDPYTSVEHTSGQQYSGILSATGAGGDTVGGIHAGLGGSSGTANWYALIGARVTNASGWKNASPGPVINGDYLPGIAFAGQTNATAGSGMKIGAAVLGQVDGAVSSGALPTSIVFRTSLTDSAGLSEKMRVTSAGNVGIGTSNPSFKLHVSGAVPAGDGMVAGVTNTDSTGIARFGAYNDTGNSASFNVYGSLFGVAGLRNNAVIGADQSLILMSDGQVGTGGNNSIKFMTGGFDTNTQVRMTIDSAGKVGIGTTTPNEKLEVNGNIRMTPLNGGGTTTASIDNNGNIVRTASDERLKENIQPLENSLEKLLNLRGVSYQWKNRSSWGEEREIGFIAQELETVVPEVVRKSPDAAQTRAVNLPNLIALVVEAVKEFHDRFVAHERSLASVQAENKSLRERVEILEAQRLQSEKESAALRAYICNKDRAAALCR